MNAAIFSNETNVAIFFSSVFARLLETFARDTQPLDDLGIGLEFFHQQIILRFHLCQGCFLCLIALQNVSGFALKLLVLVDHQRVG